MPIAKSKAPRKKPILYLRRRHGWRSRLRTVLQHVREHWVPRRMAS